MIINTHYIHEILKLTKGEFISFIPEGDNLNLESRFYEDTKFQYAICRYKVPHIGIIPNQPITILTSTLEMLPNDTDVEIFSDTIFTEGFEIKYQNQGEIYNDIIKEAAVKITTVNAKNLSKIKYALANDESRPIITGVNLKNDKFITMDSFRITILPHNPIVNNNFTFNGSVLSVLSKIKGNIVIYDTSNMVEFETDAGLTIITNKLEGEYLNIDSVLPKEFNTIATVENVKIINKFLKSLKKIDMITLKFSNNTLEIIGKNTDNIINNTFPCKMEGEDITIAFNRKYVVQALTGIDKCTIKLISPVQMMCIETYLKTDYLLPVILKC